MNTTALKLEKSIHFAQEIGKIVMRILDEIGKFGGAQIVTFCPILNGRVTAQIQFAQSY